MKYKNGKEIQQLSVFGDEEAEVLFKSGTQFKITDIEEFEYEGEWAYRLNLIEVDPN